MPRLVIGVGSCDNPSSITLIIIFERVVSLVFPAGSTVYARLTVWAISILESNNSW